MDKPLVSVICISFNHAPYIEEAVDSVFHQTYPNIELIIVDDASTDDSCEEIARITEEYPDIQFIKNSNNLGNCISFNKGYNLSKGDFLIDLSADDLLVSDRIEEGIKVFQRLPEDYGVHFTDADLIDSNGRFLRNHYKRDHKGKLKKPVPQGYIYPELLERYHICSPTMMYKRSLLDNLGGYDETLAYEDFDLWIRSAKKYRYAFTDKVLIQKRILAGSLSDNQYISGSKILESTFKICQKAEAINENDRDQLALVRRIRYELKQAIFTGSRDIANQFYDLLIRHDRNIFYRLIFRIWIMLKNIV